MTSGLRKLVLGVALAAVVPAMGAELAVLHNGFSIRCQRREQIGSVTRLYVTDHGKSFVDVPTDMIDHFDQDLVDPDPADKAPADKNLTPPAAAAPLAAVPAAANSPKLDQVVTTAGAAHHLDPDLINSVIHAESGFNPHAVSPKGAQGLMQLMPQTASRLGVANSFDPRANVEGGTAYLRTLLERYNFDLIKALAAYNAGPQRVEQYRGVPPYHETQAYVARIIRDFNRKKLAEQKTAAAATTTKSAHRKPQTGVQAAAVPNLAPQVSR